MASKQNNLNIDKEESSMGSVSTNDLSMVVNLPNDEKESSMKTLIIVILDESGSMETKKADTIGGFNGFIDRQKAVEDDEAHFYMVKFNTVTTMVHKGVPMKDVPHLTEKCYIPAGGTALFDAIAEGVGIAEKNKTTDDRVICVVMTDGEENSSKETTKEQVKRLISGKEAQGDWTFLYIGENPERWSEDTGVHYSNVVAFDHLKPGTNFMKASSAIETFRQQKSKQSRNLFVLKP